ncbi:hypothetical protein [Calidifontibacter terrae]
MLTTAQEAIAHNEGDYASNMRALLAADAVETKQFGLLASVVKVYETAVSDAAQQATAAAEKVERKPLGEVGDKVQITGVLTIAMTVDGFAYNSTQRFLIIDAGPTLAKIYTAAGWSYDVEVGDTVTLTATVKKHQTYREEIQTVLTRAKLVERVAATD